MATTKKPPVEYTTIKIGEYEATTKKLGKHKRKVYSRVPKATAVKLGVKGNDQGEKIITKIKKGRAAGAQYASYQLGVKGKGYKFGLLKVGSTTGPAAVPGSGAGPTGAASKGTASLTYDMVSIPVPSGTPAHVMAKFNATLKRKAQKIVTPGGRTLYLNNSKNSQGK
jgi:hypothetical protein